MKFIRRVKCIAKELAAKPVVSRRQITRYTLNIKSAQTKFGNELGEFARLDGLGE